MLIKWEKLKAPCWWSHSQVPLYLEEYKEPRKGIFYVNVVDNNGWFELGGARLTREAVDNLPSAENRIAVAKIEWVEGQYPE